MKKYDFSTAIRALKKGSLIIYPTDTLYALGADIYNEAAVRKVFEIKERPFSEPLPVGVASIPMMETIAMMSSTSRLVCQHFLPGALTVILKKKQIVPDVVTGDHETIAVRIPKNSLALELLSRFGPLTITSANIHHEKTLEVISEIRMQLRMPDILGIDNGRLSDAPSTIIDLSRSPPRVVRKGLITEKELLDVIADG